MTTPSSPVQELTADQSWQLVRQSQVGRMAVVVEGSPDIFPVNHTVDHGSVVFRTTVGTKLSAAVGSRVAYEVDGYDPASGQAWSVVLKGIAREVRQLHQLMEIVDLPVFPWHDGPKPRFVRIEAEEVTGRRFVVRAAAAVPAAQRSPSE